MAKALDILPDRFFRIHKSYIINFEHVDRIDADEVMIRDTRLPIGDMYRAALFKRMKRIP
jgi:DNA-binding LytR/AlgR family response regulator